MSGLRVDTGDTITLRAFGTTRRVNADGVFVAVSLRLENTRDEPLRSQRPNLVIDGKRYAADVSNEFYLQPETPFPIQPDARETVAYVFDIPASAARRAKSEGALEFNADERDTPAEYAASLGRIRLGGAPPLPGGRVG